MQLRHLAFALLVMATSSRSAPAADTSQSAGGDARQSDRSILQDEEQQLEKLKSSASASGMAVSESIAQTVTNINGNVKSVSQKEEKVQDPTTGKTMAQVVQQIVGTQKDDKAKPDVHTKTVVDIPSKGVHRTMVGHNGHLDSRSASSMSNSRESSEDYYQPVEGIQYSPVDMAEYIFRTGDEDGVTMAIEELMREGLLTQEDAISYLKEVKMDLEILRAQEERSTRMKELAARRAALVASQLQESQDLEERSHLRDRLSSSKRMSSRMHYPDDEDEEFEAEPQGPEYEEMMDRLRMAEYMSKELSLEEVMYQLAKQMFSQNIIKGNKEAEEALQRFTDFLQEESAKGRISPELQRKVIDVMLAALVDTIGEHPELGGFQEAGPVVLPRPQSSRNNEKKNKEQLLKDKTTNKEQLTADKASIKKSETLNPKNDLNKKSAAHN